MRLSFGTDGRVREIPFGYRIAGVQVDESYLGRVVTIDLEEMPSSMPPNEVMSGGTDPEAFRFCVQYHDGVDHFPCTEEEGKAAIRSFLDCPEGRAFHLAGRYAFDRRSVCKVGLQAYGEE